MGKHSEALAISDSVTYRSEAIDDYPKSLPHSLI
jgi:hypothetical protein